MFKISFENSEILRCLALICVDEGIFFSKEECALYALQGNDKVLKIVFN